MSLYGLKPGFQKLLRPAVNRLARAGITANQVTVAAEIISILLGAFIALNAHVPVLFGLLPLWLFLRMALNAIDGMLAREFNQESLLGAYLNELCDVVADTALYLPFAFVPAFGPFLVGLVIFLSFMSEFAGVLGAVVGAERRYDGPMGKSDRALVFGTLGATVALAPSLPQWSAAVLFVVALLLGLTIFRRVRAGLVEAQAG